MTTEQKVAQALLTIGAVGFSFDKSITFKSGIVSPVYVDNRKLPFHPAEWKIVLEGFKDLVEEKNINFEIVAGVEAAGIPHSAALGFLLEKPSVFIRKEAKDHGTKKMVEGGDVSGKKVLLIEDLVSTGGSSLKAIESLRGEGAIADNAFTIVSYGFRDSKDAFEKAGVVLYTLTTFAVILEEAEKMNLLNKEESEKVKTWLAEHN